MITTSVVLFIVYYVLNVFLSIHTWRMRYDVTIGILLWVLILWWVAGWYIYLLNRNWGDGIVLWKAYEEKLRWNP